jgi:hypothetical protein
MPIPESFGLAALTWELCAEGLKGIVGNRADALAVSAWGHIRERFQGLDLPDYQVLQRAVAAAHWEAVKQAASLYGPGLEARGMGVMAQADQRALKALREHAQARVHELADTSRSLPVGQDEELQEALGRLEEPSVGTGGLRGYAELVFQALPGAGDLSPGFREYFVVQWFDLLASNFQRRVQLQPEVADQLFGKFLAEIHLKLPDGRMVGEKE